MTDNQTLEESVLMKLVAGFSLWLMVMAAVTSVCAQVLTPMELSDVKAERLQQRYFKTLAAIGGEIDAHKFPYPFYFSRVLDIDQSKMPTSDQRSIRFDVYKNQTVLEITGNYYAAYSAEVMAPHDRLKNTFQQVVMPMLQAAVPHFPDDSAFSAFAIEVAHHVRAKAKGISSEHPENVTVIIPVTSAQKLVDAKTDDQKQAAILEAQVFLNGEPYSLWLQEGIPPEEWKERNAARPSQKKQPTEAAAVSTQAASGPSVSATLVKASPPTLRIITPESLSKLEHLNDEAISTHDPGTRQASAIPGLCAAQFRWISSGRVLAAHDHDPAQRSRRSLSL